jgi:hypothetical protein
LSLEGRDQAEIGLEGGLDVGVDGVESVPLALEAFKAGRGVLRGARLSRRALASLLSLVAGQSLASRRRRSIRGGGHAGWDSPQRVAGILRINVSTVIDR